MGRGEEMHIAGAEKESNRIENEISKLVSVTNANDLKNMQAFLKSELQGYEFEDTLRVDGNFNDNTKEYLKAYVEMSLGEEHYNKIEKAISTNLKAMEPVEKKLTKEFIKMDDSLLEEK
jgi:flagellar motor switch protein FliG